MALKRSAMSTFSAWQPVNVVHAGPPDALRHSLSLAYTSQGPSIQPMLVGQQTTSPRRTSWWKKALAAQRSGVVWAQGMALGSPAGVMASRQRIRLLGWLACAQTTCIEYEGAATKAASSSTPVSKSLVIWSMW